MVQYSTVRMENRNYSRQQVSEKGLTGDKLLTWKIRISDN